MREKIALLLCCLLLVGCKSDSRREIETRQAREADRLFQKRVQCGQFLERIDGSATGPHMKDREKGDLLPLNPLVFYSAKLNTCVLITSSVTGVLPHTQTFFDVSDLLTGKSLEWKEIDSSDRQGVQETNKYADELADKYSK